jgi:protein-S-isoprenylcysteine O-methyltransferase Ste14
MTSSQCLVKPVLNTLLFTILVPATAAGWIPLWLRGNASITDMVALCGVSILLIAVGVAIYLHTAFWGFALHGLGTPAPIAPTKKLVVVGLHRYVRNPMYIGVALVVLGQAMLFWSGHLLRYAVLFLIGEAIRPGIRRLSETGAALDSPLPAVTAIVCAAA